MQTSATEDAMGLEGFYDSISGDLAQARSCLATDDRVMKFLKMFLDEPVYAQLCSAMEAGDMEGAFSAVHTMKGLAVGMGFTELHDACDRLTEALRPDGSGAPSALEQVPLLFEQVQRAYDAIATAYESSFEVP